MGRVQAAPKAPGTLESCRLWLSGMRKFLEVHFEPESHVPP